LYRQWGKKNQTGMTNKKRSPQRPDLRLTKQRLQITDAEGVENTGLVEVVRLFWPEKGRTSTPGKKKKKEGCFFLASFLKKLQNKRREQGEKKWAQNTNPWGGW